MAAGKEHDKMIDIIKKLYMLIFLIRIEIKAMSNDEFNLLINELDYQTALYALYFRYHEDF